MLDGGSTERQGVSVFAEDIRTIAQQRHVELTRAAALVRDAGVSGFDIGYREDGFEDILKAGLLPANLYGRVDFISADSGSADMEEFVEKAIKYGFPRVMVIPNDFKDGMANEAEVERMVAGLRSFVARATNAGITPMIEDFGMVSNPCSHVKYLKRFMSEIPELKFALDTGNLYYAGRGEDILEVLAFAREKIEHVHLKDQTSSANRMFVSLGLGCVPNKRIYHELLTEVGYRGWLTLENFEMSDVLVDVHRQVAVLDCWRRDLMCKVVSDDGNLHLEEGFKWLFNGTDMTGWVGGTNTYKATPAGTMLYHAGRCNDEDPSCGDSVWTEREYGDFELRFEFRMTAECNNGLAIRSPLNVTAAYEGMEIQIIDDSAPYYRQELKLQDYQCCGSVYGVAAARKGLLNRVGEWNEERVIATGSRIRVLLNGAAAVDVDVSKWKGNGDTVDALPHPGLHNARGHIGWQGHGYDVEFKNIRIKEL